MRPPSSESRSRGAIALVMSHVPRTLTAMTLSQVWMWVFSKVLPPMAVGMAPLFTRPSMWPYCVATFAANASIELGSPRSTGMKAAFAPDRRSASAVASPQSARTSATTISFAIAAAQASAKARPRPRPAPVIRMVRPCRVIGAGSRGEPCPRRQIVQHACFDGDHDAVERDADQRQQDDGDEDLGGVARAFGEGQQVAEADIAANQLADQDADHRQGGRDPEAREQGRHGGRKIDLPEDLEAGGQE